MLEIIVLLFYNILRHVPYYGSRHSGYVHCPGSNRSGHCGMQVVGISCVTNMAAGVLPVKLSHEEVTETANRVKEVFQKLIDLIVGIV